MTLYGPFIYYNRASKDKFLNSRLYTRMNTSLQLLWKETWPNAAKAVGFLIIVYLALYSLKPQTFVGFAFIISTLSSLFFLLLKPRSGLKKLLLYYAKVFLLATIIYVLAKQLGAYGFLGILALIVIYTLYLLWKRKEQYLEAMRTIESMVWGQPLDSFKKEPEKENERSISQKN